VTGTTTAQRSKKRKPNYIVLQYNIIIFSDEKNKNSSLHRTAVVLRRPFCVLDFPVRAALTYRIVMIQCNSYNVLYLAILLSSHNIYLQDIVTAKMNAIYIPRRRWWLIIIIIVYRRSRDLIYNIFN